MPVVTIHVGRIDFGQSSGMIYSFEPIEPREGQMGDTPVRIFRSAIIDVQTPEDYELEEVRDASPYGDCGAVRMVFNPELSAEGTTGRVYMRAARIVEMMRSGTGEFFQIGPGRG